MDVTKRLIDCAPAYLSDDGWLAVEVGTQAREVADYFTGNGWRDIATRQDLAGRARVVLARPPRGSRDG
jgi:methylase of polypeptide subunit release factors